MDREGERDRFFMPSRTWFPVGVTLTIVVLVIGVILWLFVQKDELEERFSYQLAKELDPLLREIEKNSKATEILVERVNVLGERIKAIDANIVRQVQQLQSHERTFSHEGIRLHLSENYMSRNELNVLLAQLRDDIQEVKNDVREIKNDIKIALNAVRN